jgi:predicted  nucleic acid-binding Zn-ribbon protein
MLEVGQKERVVLGELDQLMQLQVIDYDLGELERSKEYLPDMMGNLNREINEARTKYETTKKALEEAKIKQHKLELDVKTKQQELEKYQQQMMSIKTNKEYDALVSQIDKIKGDVDVAETEILNTIDQVKDLEKHIDDYKKQLNDTEENNKKQLSVLQEKMDSIGDKVAAKDKERQVVLGGVPRSILSVYERVRRGKGGDVVVSVKKRACGACYKSLTPKKAQEIKGGGKIFTCDYCGRILYWDDRESV